MNQVSRYVSDFDKISACTNADWIAKEIGRQIQRTTFGIARLSVLIYRAQQLGLNIPIRGLGIYIKIAKGELSPKAFIEFEDRPKLARVLSTVKSIKVQEQLANGKPLDIATESGEVVKKSLQQMTQNEINRVFVGGAIVSAAEQVKVVKAERKAAEKPWRFDRKTQTLTVTKPCRISAEVLRRLVKVK